MSRYNSWSSYSYIPAQEDTQRFPSIGRMKIGYNYPGYQNNTMALDVRYSTRLLYSNDSYDYIADNCNGLTEYGFEFRIPSNVSAYHDPYVLNLFLYSVKTNDGYEEVVNIPIIFGNQTVSAREPRSYSTPTRETDGGYWNKGWIGGTYIAYPTSVRVGGDKYNDYVRLALCAAPRNDNTAKITFYFGCTRQSMLEPESIYDYLKDSNGNAFTEVDIILPCYPKPVNISPPPSTELYLGDSYDFNLDSSTLMDKYSNVYFAVYGQYKGKDSSVLSSTTRLNYGHLPHGETISLEFNESLGSIIPTTYNGVIMLQVLTYIDPPSEDDLTDDYLYGGFRISIDCDVPRYEIPIGLIPGAYLINPPYPEGELPFGISSKSSIGWNIEQRLTFGSPIVRTTIDVFDKDNNLINSRSSGVEPYSGNILIQKDGKIKVRLTLTDDRGVTASKTQEFDFLVYEDPKVLSTTIFRCHDGQSTTEDELGEWIRVRCNASISSLNYGGTEYNEIKSIKFKAKKNNSDHVPEEINLANNTSMNTQYHYVEDGTIKVSPFLQPYAYDFEILVSDTLGTTTYRGSISVSKITFHLISGGHGIGIGRYCSLPSVDSPEVQSDWPILAKAFKVLNESGIPFAGHSFTPVVWGVDKKDPTAKPRYETFIKIKTPGRYIFFGLSSIPIGTDPNTLDQGPKWREEEKSNDYNGIFYSKVFGFTENNQLGGLYYSKTGGIAVLDIVSGNVNIRFGCTKESTESRYEDFRNEYSMIVGINIGDRVSESDLHDNGL